MRLFLILACAWMVLHGARIFVNARTALGRVFGWAVALWAVAALSLLFHVRGH